MVQGAEAAFTEPELQSMDRTCSLEPEADTRTGEKEKVLMRNLPGYVKICHVPENYTFDKLSGELLRANLPVPFERLIFLDGMQEALLICKTSKDAQQLSKFSGDTSFSFFCGEEQPLGNFTLTLKNEDLEELRRKKNFRNFQDGLNKLHINFDMDGSLEVKVKTFYQLTCIDKLMKMLLHTDPENTGSRFVMTSGEDDFEHILEATVNIEGATDRIWQVMQVEKANKIKEFRETCGTISHSEDVLTIKRRDIEASDSTFDDFVTVFKSFVEGMKPMEFEDIPVDDKFVDKIPTWQEEIENTLNKHCCTFIQEQKKVIAYFDSYEKTKQIEHHFLVKQEKRKQTARRRQKGATTKDGPESLQSEYVQSSATKKADFEWSRDAENCATFKTTEGVQVYVYKANILKLPVDCIVNAANDTLQHGGGVAQVIARGAGQELTDEGNRYIRKKGKIPVGQVVSTTAGKLPYRYVMHAVGPRWAEYAPHYDNDVQRCENDLYNAIYNSFLEADKKGLQTIALPAISAAIFAVPIDLCVSQYVEATIQYSSKKNSMTNIKEIHFIDINPRIVRAIQREFETVLVQGKVSPYDRQKHVQLPRGYRHRSPKTNNEASCQNFKFQNNGRRTHNQTVYEKKGADLMKDVSFSTGEVTKYSEGDKHVYLLGGTDVHKLFVYTSDILELKDSAIVVPLDEYLVVGAIGRAVNEAIDKRLRSNYRQALEKILPLRAATGTVAITKGFGSGFTCIIHIVYPYREREQDITFRRKTLTTAFQNIFLQAMKVKDVKKVATTIFGIVTLLVGDRIWAIHCRGNTYQARAKPDMDF
ncbi:uncharacterized protein LOC128559649 [Mercenaria mercenaria]|uniref:uncharacterized protein LOC128559649 n=1 Tax=Mercenaria mercenaria TaxID=6596 RepID=UPI00234FB071|nr:uncharacterized protein LOC128559649 [Mercenaria mercenaria]